MLILYPATFLNSLIIKVFFWNHCTNKIKDNDLRGKAFSFSMLNILAVGFSYVAFFMLKQFFSVPRLLSVFIIKWC